MKSLKEQIMGKCRHFNGLMNKACEVGVKYDDVCTPCTDGVGKNIPCLFKGDATCEKRQVVTEDEADAEIEEHKKRFARVGIARKAIVDHLGGPWKKGTAGAGGKIPCPNCQTGTLAFSRAGSNGHINAACSTTDCVSWME